MPDGRDAPAIFTGGDGAVIRLKIENDALHVDYEAAGIEAPHCRVFLALDSDPAGGSAVVPFGRNAEGSAVFLPFNADRIVTVEAATATAGATGADGAAATTSVRRWNTSQWSEPESETAVFTAELSRGRCLCVLDLAELKRPPRLGLVLYAKNLRENRGWGDLFGASDPTVTRGFGDRTIRHYLEVELLPAFEDRPATMMVRQVPRLRTGTRVRIYQLFVRLFGNTNETRKTNGTLAENGVGKFADINDAALDAIAGMGFTHVWLTGVMEQATATDYSGIGAPADDPDLLKGLAGSPYAIKDCFDVSPDYAVDPARRLAEFKALLDRIHAHRLAAIIDLVPNHVARSYSSDVMPGISFGVKDDRTKFFDPRNNFFYLRPDDPGGGAPLKLPTVADGRPVSATCMLLPDPGSRCDGHFEGEREFGRVTGNNVVSWAPGLHDWYETVKLNFGVDFTDPSRREIPTAAQPDKPIPDTWWKLDAIIEYWQALGVDGFRCDMSHMVPPEFWHWSIGRARARNAQAFFMGEAYDTDPAKLRGSNPVTAALSNGRGNVMFDLLDAGFNAVYDDPTYKVLKRIYDGGAWANDIDGALGEEFIFQNSLRYAENHDEMRLAAKNAWGGVGMNVGRPVSAILFGLGRGPVMLLNGQEVGEPAEGVEGFGGDDARTTIFDYWSMPELVKWVNGHRYDGGRLSEAQKSLRAFYARLVSLVAEPAFRDGEFFSLNPANAGVANFGRVEGDPVSGHWMYAFLRFVPGRGGQGFLIAANLHPTLSFTNVPLRFPPVALERLGIGQAAEVTFRERLGESGQIMILRASGAEMLESGLTIPRIPPLTPLFFEIV